MTWVVNNAPRYRKWGREPLPLWPSTPALRTLLNVPKIRAEDRQFALRLGVVLSELRKASGETRPDAADRLGVSETSLGRWERGEFAPKGYDLGRLYRGYTRWGARWEWFFDPPEIPEVSPVRAALDDLARAGAIAADEREERVEARRRRAAEKRAVARGTRSA